MNRKVYMWGYQGHEVSDLEKLVEQSGAVVFDIRYSANSMNARWRKSHLSLILQANYQHVPELGNINYRNGNEIVIANLEAGIQRIENSDRPVLLVCVCKDRIGCHRDVIGRELASRGFDVQELSVPRFRDNGTNQMELF